MSLEKQRKTVADYFGSVTNEINLFIESEIQKAKNNLVKSNVLNSKRETLLDQVNQAQETNLKHLESLRPNSTNEDTAKPFVAFCFLLRFQQDLRLIVTDSFLSKQQIQLLQSLANLVKEGKNGYAVKLTNKSELSLLFNLDYSQQVNPHFLNI
jgi:hypothetical protein